MSRTEGFTLPRIPTSHARATSPTSIQPHLAQKMRSERHGCTIAEPSYTSYLGTPRQDVPHHVYKDIAMYEDVFEKRGSFVKKHTHSISCPLSQEYNSLHDAHCRHLYLNNHKLREHLVNLGLITEDLKIVASTQQQRQKIRAHEILERKELLLNKMNQKQTQRLSNLEVPLQLPKILSWSISREEERKKRQFEAREAKRKKLQMAWDKEQQEQNEKKRQESAQLKKLKEQQQIIKAKKQKDDVAKRLATSSRMQQLGSEVAQWHRDAELIKARMKKLKKETWSKRKRTPAGTTTVQSSVVSSSASIDEANREIMDQVNSSLARVRFGKEEVIATEKSADMRPEQASDDQDQEIIEETGNIALEEVEKTTTEDIPERETTSEDENEQRTELLDVMTDATVDRDRQQVTETMASGAQVVTEVMDSRTQVVTEAISDGTQVETEQDQLAVEVLDGERSLQLFAALLLEQLSQYDQTGSGYLATQDFLQVLAGRNLGLRLKTDELYGLLAQLDPNNSGWTVYGDVVYDLAAMLLQLVVQSTPESDESQPAELQWSQLSSPSYGYLYLNRATGQIQRGRPEEYRPFLKDDIFEDSIVDFFETSDVNQDGMVDNEEFYQLLVSHDVGGRLFPSQVEQLNESFHQILAELPVKQVGLDLQQFAMVARMMITFVYRNTFPSAEEWIELDSPKVGRFWLNKDTGETHLPAQHLPPPPDEPTQESLLAKSLTTGTLSSALPTIAEGPSDEESDYVPTKDQRKHLTTDPIAISSHDDKKQQRRHKRKTRKKQIEKVAAPPPLRPRSRPASQQSGTRSEGASSGGHVAELGEGLNVTKQNDEQDMEAVKTTDSKEDTKATDSISEHIVIHDDEQVIIIEETPATGDDKIHVTDDDKIHVNDDDKIHVTDDSHGNPTNNDKETEATTE